MIDSGLYQLLLNNSAVNALVAGRIFAVEGPPDAIKMPYLVYSFVGGAADPTLDTSGVIRQRVQIDAFAMSPSGTDSPGTVAAKIRAAAIAAVDGWQQTLGDGINVLTATLLNPGTDFCTEQRIFRCMCEFYVFYTFPS